MKEGGGGRPSYLGHARLEAAHSLMLNNNIHIKKKRKHAANMLPESSMFIKVSDFNS